jgi:hypothetical protein
VEHAWQPSGRHHGDTALDDLGPGDLGTVDGHDRDHRHAWVGQDLGGLVGLERLAQRTPPDPDAWAQLADPPTACAPAWPTCTASTAKARPC